MCWWAGCRCDPNSTIFPDHCTENNTRIDGDLITDSWQLDDLPIYANCLVMFTIAAVCHTAAYLVLKLIRHPHTA